MRTMKTGARTAVLAAGAALACACSSTEAARPASLSIVSGDGQSGPTGAAMADSLVVLVTGSDGRGFPGANLTWLVTAGSATVAPPTSVSDATGRAAAAVTLGAVSGAVTVTATVAGVTPATFQLTSVSACNWRAPFSTAATANGFLSAADCVYTDGSYIDYYGLNLAAQQAARIRLVSTAFDAFLILTDAGGGSVAADDDSASGNTNADLPIILAPGSYVVGANSYSAGETGAYALISAVVSENISGCATPWWITPGVQTNQVLASTDCASSGYYADLMAVSLRAGRTYTITENSTAFDALLGLANSAGSIVAVDDDGGGGNNARIVYTPSVSGLYIIVAESFAAGETGAYTLAISAPVASGVAGPGDPAVVMLRKPAARWPDLAAIGVARTPKPRP